MATSCPVCKQPVGPATAPTSVWQGVTYYLRCAHCKERFDGDPERFLAQQGDEDSHMHGDMGKEWHLRPLERL